MTQDAESNKTPPKAYRVAFGLNQDGYPEDYRKLVAGLLAQEAPELVHALMNYQGNGLTRTDFPPAQFDGHRKGFALIGYGEHGAEILRGITPVIHQHLSKHTGRIVTLDYKELDMKAQASKYPIRYSVPRMLVEKKGHHKEWMENSEQGRVHLEGLFERSIKRQASALGIELPEFKATFQGARAFRHLHKLVGSRSDKTKGLSMRGLLQGQFDVNLELTGYWAVGYQLGPGFGKFNANLQRGTRQ